MSEFTKALTSSAAGLKAQATRMRHVSENIANADTPGFRRKTVPFEVIRDGIHGADNVKVGRVQLDQSELEKVYDPGHPLADETGHYNSSNVDLMIELADAREARRSYEANLKIFDQTRQMSSSLMDLLRN